MITLNLNPLGSEIQQLFSVSFDNFQTGMSNPISLFEESSYFKDLMKKKTSQKKENQKRAGREAQQDGENVKNELASKFSYKGETNNISSQSLALLKYLNLDLNNVSFINTKAHADGKFLCSKSDLRVNVQTNSNIITQQISVKSTFNTTQVSIHSISTFVKYLKKYNVTVPEEVIEFLTHFIWSESSYISKPKFIFSESQRRERFTVEEINSFNPELILKCKDFFEKNALLLLEFLISKGGESKSANFATILAFCDKKINNLLLVDIKQMISYALKQSKLDNSFFVPKKPTKHGTTTISLFAGLIVMQMKGSGTGAAYHSLQFRVNGAKIRKLINSNLI